MRTMRKKTPIELARVERVETLRTLVRLKHRINAQRELNDRCAAAVAKFDKDVQQGVLPARLDMKAIEAVLGQ